MANKKGLRAGEHFGPLDLPRKVANVLTGEHLMNNAAMASVRLALMFCLAVYIMQYITTIYYLTHSCWRKWPPPDF